MKIRRDINSIPMRSSAETWQKIIDLITRDQSKYTDDLRKVAGIVASIITDQHPSKEPIVLSGVGPRLVIYCAFGEDAVVGIENVDELQWNPTDGEWQMLLPCKKGDMSWISEALAKQTRRIRAYDVDDAEMQKESSNDTPHASAAHITVNW